MADDIPSRSTGEQADPPARRGGDDEGLRDAMAALLGLGSKGSNGGAGGFSGSIGISLPPPRQATPVDEVEAPFVAPPDPSPYSAPEAEADDFWSTSDETERPGDWSSSDALASPDAGPDDFWSRPDEPRTTAWSPSEAPAPPVPPTDDAWRPSLEPAPPESWSAADAPPPVDAEADDFWSSPVEPRPPTSESAPDGSEPSPGEPVGAPSADTGPDPWAPLGTSSPDGPAADLRVPGDADTDAPTAPVHLRPGSSGEAHREPASEREGSSVAALQDVGLGGPLNAAMGDLRRLYPDADERVTRDAALPPVLPAGGGSPAHARFQFLAAWWASRRKELVPGMVVGLVIVVAFAVVLLGRGGDSGPSGVRTTGSTTVPATDLTTVPGQGDIAPSLPLADEMVPAEPSTDSPAEGSGGSSASGDEDGASDAPPVVAATRPRRSGAQATPGPAPTAPPATPAPTAPPATTGTTQPPPATTAPPSPPPSPSDACDKLFSPAAREKCLEELRQGGND